MKTDYNSNSAFGKRKIANQKRNKNATERKRLADENATLDFHKTLGMFMSMVNSVTGDDENTQAATMGSPSEDGVSFDQLPTTVLTAAEVANLRNKIFSVVDSNIQRAHDALQGRRRWSAQQVRLFEIMLKKTMPDLSHSVVETTGSGDVNKMTVEQLLAVVAAGESQPSAQPVQQTATPEKVVNPPKS